MIKDNYLPSYCSLLFIPLFFIIFPLFTFDYTYVDEIIINQRQLTAYLHKPAIKDPVEIDRYCSLMPKNLGKFKFAFYFNL